MYKPTRLISSREPTLQRSQHTGPLMPKNVQTNAFYQKRKVKCSEIALGVGICLIVN